MTIIQDEIDVVTQNLVDSTENQVNETKNDKYFIGY